MRIYHYSIHSTPFGITISKLPVGLQRQTPIFHYKVHVHTCTYMYLCVVTTLLIVLYTVYPIPVHTYTTAMASPSRRTITGKVSGKINTLSPMFTDAVRQGTFIHIYNIQQRSNRTLYSPLKKVVGYIDSYRYIQGDREQSCDWFGLRPV